MGDSLSDSQEPLVLIDSILYGSLLGVWDILLPLLAFLVDDDISTRTMALLLILMTGAFRTRTGGISFNPGAVDKFSQLGHFIQKLCSFHQPFILIILLHNRHNSVYAKCCEEKKTKIINPPFWSTMRKRFETQLILGQTPIEQVILPTSSRDELSPILEGLRWMFMTPEVKNPVFDLLEKQVVGDKKATGRMGMDLWHILVLGVVRLGLKCDYDRLEDMANNHALIRQIMGIGPTLGMQPKAFHHRTLSENVSILDEQVLGKINAIVAKCGQQVFKIRGAAEEPLEIKIDSYVFETNVHFPTDLTLLWDAQRKCLDYVVDLCMEYGIPGWRKAKNWRARLKSAMRAVNQVKKSGGRNKSERLRRIVQHYLADSLRFETKVFESWTQLRACPLTESDNLKLTLLSYFHDELIRHIDLVERRMINGEIIPHREKVFSLFEPHTEWINKGKMFPSIELGHKIQIATVNIR